MRKLIRRLFKLIGLLLIVSIAFTAIVALRGHFFRDVEPGFAGTWNRCGRSVP